MYTYELIRCTPESRLGVHLGTAWVYTCGREALSGTSLDASQRQMEAPCHMIQILRGLIRGHIGRGVVVVGTTVQATVHRLIESMATRGARIMTAAFAFSEPCQILEMRTSMCCVQARVKWEKSILHQVH